MEFVPSELTFEVPDMHPQARLRELIIYIAEICQTDSRFGKTKLVKLLYLSDFTSFREFGKPVTGHKYVKLQNGPFPDHLDQLLKDMVNTGEIAIQEVPYSGYAHPQQRVIPLRRAVLEDFSAEDIATVDEQIREHWDRHGTAVAEITHGIVWENAEIGEAIPYEGSIISDEELTQADIEHISELIQRYGVEPTE